MTITFGSRTTLLGTYPENDRFKEIKDIYMKNFMAVSFQIAKINFLKTN